MTATAKGDAVTRTAMTETAEEDAVIVETERLFLREMTQDDYEDLCKMLQDEEVMYAYEHAFADEEAQEWLERQMKRYEDYGFGLWAVIRKETGEMIGQCGLTMQECIDTGKSTDGQEDAKTQESVETHESVSRQVLEVGYLFQKAFWHQGYATEAAVACKEYAFRELDAAEVFSIIRDNNIPSQNVAKRNGMTIKGQFTKHYYGMDMPHLVFSVKREG